MVFLPNLPSREECFSLLEEFEVPQNIIDHSLTVNKVVVFLAKRLIDAGVKINLNLVNRASLLHDIDKIQTLKTRKHGQVSKEILTKKGFPKLGEVVSNHTLLSVLNDLDWESKVLNYADVRVLFTKVVSMQKRFENFEQRYKTKIRQDVKQRYYKLEKEIFSKLDIDPEEIKI